MIATSELSVSFEPVVKEWQAQLPNGMFSHYVKLSASKCNILPKPAQPKNDIHGAALSLDNDNAIASRPGDTSNFTISQNSGFRVVLMDQSLATVSTVGCNDDPGHGEADVHRFPAARTHKSSNLPAKQQTDSSSHASGRSDGASSAALRLARSSSRQRCKTGLLVQQALPMSLTARSTSANTSPLVQQEPPMSPTALPTTTRTCTNVQLCCPTGPRAYTFCGLATCATDTTSDPADVAAAQQQQQHSSSTAKIATA